MDPDAMPFFETDSEEDLEHVRAPNYFQLLEIANETNSRPASPGPGPSRSRQHDTPNRQETNGNAAGFRSDAIAEGYFNAFFKAEQRLGMGANGSVYLCQVRASSFILLLLIDERIFPL